MTRSLIIFHRHIVCTYANIETAEQTRIPDVDRCVLRFALVASLP